MLRIGLMLVLFSLFVSGCNSTTTTMEKSDHPFAGNLVFRDTSGTVVAVGDLPLPTSIVIGKTFSGSWKLISSENDFPSGSTNKARYEGSVADERYWIDLNPGVMDNNVVLKGTWQSDGTLSGNWMTATFAGGKEMGTFTLKGKRPTVR